MVTYLRRPLPALPADRRRVAVLRGDLRSTMGYGYETRAIASLFPPDYDIYGVDLHFNPGDCGERFPGRLVDDGDVAELSGNPANSVCVVTNSKPDDYAYFPGAWNVGLFSWETDAVAYNRDWPELVSAMDANWAKTSFHQSFLRKCGWSGDIPLVPWPFDFSDDPVSKTLAPDFFLRYLPFLSELGEDDRISCDEVERLGTTFLSVSSLAPRKGLAILLSEWRDYLEAGCEGTLVLKLRAIHNEGVDRSGADYLRRLLTKAGFRAGEPTRIIYTFEDLTQDQVNRLYSAADAYVTASFGEGFGGPIVEAAVARLPVIAPRHTSFADLLPPGYPLEVDAEEVCVGLEGNSAIYPAASTWWLPVRGSLTGQLVRFSGMRDEERRDVADLARRQSQAFCSIAVVADALKRALADHVA